MLTVITQQKIMMEEIDFKNMFRRQDFTFFDHPVIQNVLFSNIGILYQMLSDHQVALERSEELINRLNLELGLEVPGNEKTKQ